ncbi:MULTISPECIES: TraB/GumN family protein [Dictyoglomus]|uniref:GumN family protein n=1 Tax=Dictyoglomus turgidum (strain DSM 6724 / Z-1310) TaxID=515635 RepID=B8E347_DICTD|nr:MULTISPECIES: TraB/GumN family protein [Dictyoglomus]ACK42921.1 GumN family protein [Dictyoglomus turgidum DSM 6724]HBU30983.1 TraB/GumN family protein [Dictyoglomus sp.]
MKYLKRLISFVIISILLLNFVFCGTKGIFYEVRSDYGKAYILGSIHYGTPDLYPLDPLIEKVFIETEALVVELDITDSQNIFKTQSYLSRRGIYKKGDSIENYLDSESVGYLKKLLGEENFEQIKIFKPWVLLLQISSSVLNSASDMRYGIDFYFLNRAKKLNKKIIPLETVEEQLDAFSEIPEEDQLNILKTILQGLKQEEHSKNDLSLLLDAYKNGDEEKLLNFLMKDREKKEYKIFYEHIFYRRNFKFAERIKRLLGEYKSLFIVVGAGHLIGENNVIKLLESEGFLGSKIF